MAARLETVRPRHGSGVLLSPFDQQSRDRARVQRLFGFSQVLEIFKPAAQRTYGYYCPPALSGERLVARFDLKADRKRGTLRVLSCRFEGTAESRPAKAQDGEAARAALSRYANALELRPTWRAGGVADGASRTLPLCRCAGTEADRIASRLTCSTVTAFVRRSLHQEA